MCNVPEHDDERNTGAAGQNDHTPTSNDNAGGNVPAGTSTTPAEGQEQSCENLGQAGVDSAVLMRHQGKLEATWKATAAAKLLAGERGKSATRIPAWLGLTIKNPVRVRVMSRIVNRFDSGRVLLR